MKKLLIVLLTIFFLSSFSIPAMAQTINHDVNVSLTSSHAKVNVGEKVVLSSVVQKHGSSFIDEWIGSELIATNFENDSYESSSTFSSDKPGLYTISYNIKMSSGKGNSIFMGSSSITIEVVDNCSIKEVSVKNLVNSEVKNSEGNIVSYYVIGNILVTLSNDEVMDYGTIFVGFNKDELSKEVDITIELNGEKSTYKVNIKRM